MCASLSYQTVEEPQKEKTHNKQTLDFSMLDIGLNYWKIVLMLCIIQALILHILIDIFFKNYYPYKHQEASLSELQSAFCSNLKFFPLAVVLSPCV